MSRSRMMHVRDEWSCYVKALSGVIVQIRTLHCLACYFGENLKKILVVAYVPVQTQLHQKLIFKPFQQVLFLLCKISIPA